MDQAKSKGGSVLTEARLCEGEIKQQCIKIPACAGMTSLSVIHASKQEMLRCAQHDNNKKTELYPKRYIPHLPLGFSTPSLRIFVFFKPAKAQFCQNQQ
ncbi:hypothetical protein OC25_26390 [Pedobacter kyungheensis]|uniref:Uncharacterized protein n=1 Tax=Pedobacter kyungheensis TaxID=1069985 RepID=A0A0C1D316_9SPHI|nr:hypothetical protein OC25_26390 [Pedobacter kyungheensis]